MTPTKIIAVIIGILAVVILFSVVGLIHLVDLSGKLFERQD
jgi:hypothetical protein